MRLALLRQRLLVAALFVHTGCASVGSTTSTSAADPSGASIRFFAVCAACEGSSLLPGVEVTAVGATGTFTPLGKTDVSGSLLVSKAALRRLSASHLLFCHPAFECSAVLVGSGVDTLRADEYPVSMVVHSVL